MRTIVEINGTKYKVVPQRFKWPWVLSCDLCDCLSKTDGCTVASKFDCRVFDTLEYSVHLELATPEIRLNTPSEARREATGI